MLTARSCSCTPGCWSTHRRERRSIASRESFAIDPSVLLTFHARKRRSPAPQLTSSTATSMKMPTALFTATYKTSSETGWETRYRPRRRQFSSLLFTPFLLSLSSVRFLKHIVQFWVRLLSLSCQCPFSFFQSCTPQELRRQAVFIPMYPEPGKAARDYVHGSVMRRSRHLSCFHTLRLSSLPDSPVITMGQPLLLHNSATNGMYTCVHY